MPIELTREETEALIPSLQKYFQEELDEELTELRAKLLLGFVQQEIAPYAYNRGVRDAEKYFRGKVEDLTALCYEEPLTYWTRKKKHSG